MDEKNVSSTQTKKNSTIPYILKGEFFEILKQEGEAVTVRCKKCPQKNIYKGSVKSTGNFHMHIKRKHPESLERLQELKLKSFMDRKVKIPDRLKNSHFSFIQNESKNKSGQYTITSVSTMPVVPEIRITQNPNQRKENGQTIDCTKLSSAEHDKIFSPQTSTSMDFCSNNQAPFIENVSDQKLSFRTDQQGAPLSNQNDILQEQNCIIQQNSFAATLTAASMILSPTQDMLCRIDTHLKSIERQLQLRNQIETNRIYLDFAKFKFLNPNFAFQG